MYLCHRRFAVSDDSWFWHQTLNSPHTYVRTCCHCSGRHVHTCNGKAKQKLGHILLSTAIMKNTWSLHHRTATGTQRIAIHKTSSGYKKNYAKCCMKAIQNNNLLIRIHIIYQLLFKLFKLNLVKYWSELYSFFCIKWHWFVNDKTNMCLKNTYKYMWICYALG